MQHYIKTAVLERLNYWSVNAPCRREKYASVAFFMISELQVTSVNISRSLALVDLRSLNVSNK